MLRLMLLSLRRMSLSQWPCLLAAMLHLLAPLCHAARHLPRDFAAETANGSPSTANSPTVEYTRGPDMGGGVGGLLYSSRSEGILPSPTLKYALSNGRGDIVAQADQNAVLTWTASYEAYGKRTKETGTNQDKQRANSKDEDPTGLLNEGFRYRDIETGVWLSRDPAGFVDGPNLYAYVKQNPWSKFDPNGLSGLNLFKKAAGNGAKDGAYKAVSGALKEALGSKHGLFKVHHVLHQDLWKSNKMGKWLDDLGVNKDTLDNITILPTSKGREVLKGTDDAARSLHDGGHLKDYFKTLESELQTIQKRHGAGEIDSSAAKTAVENMQRTTREGLENGTIKLQDKGEDAMHDLGILLAIPASSKIGQLVTDMRQTQASIDEGKKTFSAAEKVKGVPYVEGAAKFVDEWINPFTAALDTVEMMEGAGNAYQMRQHAKESEQKK